MAFTPRYTQPTASGYYGSWNTYNRFGWLFADNDYGGNCTGYAYGRTSEIAGRNIHDDFYITQSPGNGKDWIYNSWPEYTHTSGAIDIHLGDILVWGGGTYGHVEVVEAINGNKLTVSYSVYGETYGSSREFGIRTVDYPSWGSYMGVWTDNDGNDHNYTNTFIGYIHNKYLDEPGPGPEPEEPTIYISPASYTKTMGAEEDYVDFPFTITIEGIPVGESASGGNTYPGLERVANTGWSYSSYAVDGVIYQRATKSQTLRYRRESDGEYSVTKHMYFNMTFSNGSISSDTRMVINVEKKKPKGVLFLEWDGATVMIL